MKKLLTILTIFISLAASAQSGKIYPSDNTAYGVHYPRGNFDTALHIPVLKDTFSVRDNSKYKDSAEIGIFQGELWYKLPRGFWKKTGSGNGTIDLSAYYTKQGVDSAVAAKAIDMIIDNNTLTGSAIDADPLRVNTAVIATVASLNNYLLKSDTTGKWQPKINGKQLSTEDYTTAEKTKLSGIAPGATNVTNNNQLTNGAGFITSSALSPYELSSHANSNFYNSISYVNDSTIAFGRSNGTKDTLVIGGSIGGGSSSGSNISFNGTTAQYIRGDGSMATFPTDNTAFSNGANYITSSALSPYATITSLNSYLFKSDTATMLSPYLRVNIAASTYQPIGSYAAASHTHVAANITDFQSSVSANTDVTANTAARHTHTNITALNAVSGTNTGDETLSSIKTKLGITTLSGSNTGDQDLSGLVAKANNLSDLANAATARTNLGLGTLATQNGTFSGTSSGTNTGDETPARINALYGYTPANPANFQPLENQRLSTTNTPTFAGLSSTAPINLIGIATPSAPTTGTQLVYANSTGAFTLMGSNGFALSFSKNRLTASRTVYVQDKDYTFGDSADIAAVAASFAAQPSATQTLTNKTISGSSNTLTNISASNVNSGTLPTAQTAAFSGDVSKAAGSATTTISSQFKNDYDLNIYQALGSAILAEPYPVSRISGSQATTTGQLRFVAAWLPTATTLTGVKWYQGTAGNYTANNYNGVGLYTYSGGTLTLVASSTNDGTIWTQASGTWGSKAFSSTYAASAGLYFIGFIYNSSAQTTAPALGAVVSTTSAIVDFTNSAKISSVIISISSLPATVTMSSLTASTTFYYAALY